MGPKYFNFMHDNDKKHKLMLTSVFLKRDTLMQSYYQLSDSDHFKIMWYIVKEKIAFVESKNLSKFKVEIIKA